MIKRNEEVPHSTEDKSWWCLYGQELEEKFVEICTKKLKIPAIINPEKKENKYAPDLYVKNRLSDLKTQNTPFFTSSKYKCDPQYTVTFNRKDYERYKEKYPNIDIYYLVEWTQLDYKTYHVDFLGGIYVLPFKELSVLIENGAPEHFYIFRQGDTKGNAKSSFLLDLRKFQNIFSLKKRLDNPKI